MYPTIETKQVCKDFKGFPAVKDVSLRIHQGEIYGFIGLNGAGKTTTIKMLLGMIRPSKGTCTILGQPVHFKNHHLWKKVGYIVETPHAYPELTVEENLELFRQLRFISDLNRVGQVMSQLRLTPYAQTKAKQLSMGNAQRLGIAKAILHRPNILILDEPMNGLDPAGTVEVRNLLQDLAHQHGVTILISSHLLGEIAKIATKIGIIHEGTLIEEIRSTELKKRLHQRLVIHTLKNSSAFKKITAIGYSANINKNGHIEMYDKRVIDHPERISSFLVNEGVPPTRLAVEVEDLEAYFLRVIDEKGGVCR